MLHIKVEVYKQCLISSVLDISFLKSYIDLLYR